MGNKPAMSQSIFASVDWITATTPINKTGLHWYELFYRRAKEMYPQVFTTTPSRAKYFGYEGQELDGLFWGYRPNQGYMLVAKGRTGDELWPAIAPTARRVSRLDLAVTVDLTRPVVNLAKSAYEDNRTVGGQRQYAYITNSKGGQTLYVGSRQSGQFGRLYDKGAQEGSAAPGVRWRYEVEIKDKLRTLPTLDLMYQAWLCDKPWRVDITKAVHNWFSNRGVSPRFARLAGNDIFDIAVEARVSGTDRKLAWLSKQVAPTVQELIRQGVGDKAMLALGLEAEQLPFWSHGVVGLSGDNGKT